MYSGQRGRIEEALAAAAGGTAQDAVPTGAGHTGGGEGKADTPA